MKIISQGIISNEENIGVYTMDISVVNGWSMQAVNTVKAQNWPIFLLLLRGFEPPTKDSTFIT